MNKLSALLFAMLLSASFVGAAPFARWNSTELTLDNGVVERTIQLPSPQGNFLTRTYQPVGGNSNFFEPTNTDFQFEAGGVFYSGKSDWSLIGIKTITDSLQGDGAAVSLRSDDKQIEVTVKFLLYPDSPAVRKSLVVKNLGAKEIPLESVDVERLCATNYWTTTFSWIFSDYGRRRSIGPYDGNMQDALVIVHNPDSEVGIVIGNEAPGVMKHTSVFWESPEICSGLTHQDARFPFRKWLKAGESFETPQVFTMVYNHQQDPDEILNTAVPDFVRKDMGIRLSQLNEKPTFVYNTWSPFKGNINERLIMELAKAAAAAGIKEFVIDDGWEDQLGDWGVNTNKFPHGLKPVFDYIKSLGMKPGLWVSLGTAAPGSKVYQAHPDWFVKDKNGNPTSLVIEDVDKYTACFSTGWNDYISGVLKKLVAENGLEYLKLDFSVVTSPYRFDPAESGCYATDHPGHKDHAESLSANYEPMWKLFDGLHQLHPKLFIDCTFETMGGLQLIDYAILKHAEGDWLANFYAADEKGDLRMRNIAWWRSPAMPATALVIGNLKMNDPGWENHMKSLAGALPIMLGDPRKLSAANLKKYRGYADWLQSMQAKYDMMSYRQDLPGFGEPREGSWDGFQRINTETRAGGIIGVFRLGAVEARRVVTIRYLNPDKNYDVKTMAGNVIHTATGQELSAAGFTVSLKDVDDGELFEISLH